MANQTKKEVNGLLVYDRKKILLELRNFSLRHRREEGKEDFKFTYEFPVRQGKQQKFEYSVTFNDDSFPMKPYGFCQDAMKQKGMVTLNSPVFESYQQILPFCSPQIMLSGFGTVEITLVTFETEQLFGTMKKGDVDLNTRLLMHMPKVLQEDDKPAINLNIDRTKYSVLDRLESFCSEKDARLDTSIVVQSLDYEDERQSVDLITIPDFFFPSLAVR